MMHKIIAFTFALLLGVSGWAQAWPAAWQPGDKSYESEQSFTQAPSGAAISVERRTYSDGTLVILVGGREFLVDTDPDNPCTPYWIDSAMAAISPRGFSLYLPSEWGEAAWKQTPSQSSLCKEA